MDIEKFQKIKILYVEDEIELRDTTCRSLGSIVSNIEVASNGKEGLEKFKDGNFDIIITDLAMPIMDGSDMIIEIRKIDKEIPILVTTAFGSQNKAVGKLIDIGMSEYQMKPIDMMKLVKSIDGLVQF